MDGPSPDFYITGGTMSPDADSYVVRGADEELYRAVAAGEYCYVLTTRQMGKSSLMARTARQLATEGVRSAQVTLETIRESGSAANPQQFLFGIANQIHKEVGLTTKLKDWWQERELQTATQRFHDFLAELLLEECEGPVAVFVDEIDSTIGLPFADDFFATIRACWNDRASKPDLKRLTFILLGVATPAQLIADPTRTPFNIGRGIELADFTLLEAEPLARGFPGSESTRRTLLERVLYWTGGHPYLSQTVCRAIARVQTTDGATDSSTTALNTVVDLAVERLFFTSEAAREERNLKFVRSRLTLAHPDLDSVLLTYEQVLTEKVVEDNPASSIYASLKLAGVVRVNVEGHLQVRNRIYERVFGRDWVRRERVARRAVVTSEPVKIARQPRAEKQPALRITVTNGDLTFEPEALLIGHYRATWLTGAESVVDRLVGGAMRYWLKGGLYPSRVGSHQVFINNRPALERGSFLPRPKAVIVVGLGEEGRLLATDLTFTVRQGVLAFAQRLTEHKRGVPKSLELATTLLGSGGAGITPGEAAGLVAQGVLEANEILKHAYPFYGSRWLVRHLHIIELYMDRATEAWHSLQMEESLNSGRYDVGDAVKAGIGGLQRPPHLGYRGVDYDLMTVEMQGHEDGEPLVSYTLDTARARSEVRGRRVYSQQLRELVVNASNDQIRDEKIGRTLRNQLIPVELEPYLSGSGSMQLEVDPGTARMPWELLDSNTDDAGDRYPWAIRVRLLRKLRIAGFRDDVIGVDAETTALVVGEPESDPTYPRLYGARSEAVVVRTCLTQGGALDEFMVTALISADASEVGSSAREVLTTLFEKPWRIVHITGHGMPGRNGKPGGVVLSSGTFLGPDEIHKMRTVPELVFVNCCHLPSFDADQLQKYDRVSFASGFAGALIEIGVRCVIAAGWAVDDDAASVFAETFYGSLLRGKRFVDAVGDARKAAYERSAQVNTWAAYQCYGDPDWVFRLKAFDADELIAPSIDDFSGVASTQSLKLALERIVVQTKYQGADAAMQLNNLRHLEERFGSQWGKSGAVAELFGEAFVEAGDVETGMKRYERAVSAPDAKGSMKAAEQLANVRGRLGWEIVDKAMRHLDEMKKRERAGGQTTKARAVARRARAEAARSLLKAVARADNLIEQSIALLMKLIAVEQTMERAMLIGSAYKRRALVSGAAGRRTQIQQALRQMKCAYEDAQAVGRKSGASDLYYPASNRLAADVALHAGERRWRSLDRETATLLRKSLKEKSAIDPDFWSVVGETELDQYEAMAKRKLAPARRQLEKAYEDLHKRVTATRMWQPVYDTACLVLPNYASRATGKERAAAAELLVQLRTFAHPEYVPFDDDRHARLSG